MAPEPGPIAYAPSQRGHVAYQVTGAQGPWLVLLPTLTASFESYWELPAARAFLEALASHCRVVLLDARGTGSSDPLAPGEAPDARARAADVVAVLAALDATGAVLVGEAYDGGPTALRAAAAAPDRTARVVVINLPLTPVRGDLDRDTLVQRVLWGGEDRLYELGLLPSVQDDPTWAAWAERAGRATGPAVARGRWEAMLDYDLSDVVDAVTVPVTVISTGHWIAPQAGVVALATALPDATVVEVPRQDGLLFLGDTRQLVVELLRQAIGRAVPGPLTRELRAVLVSDLQASTARAAELGDARWRQQLDVHDAIVQHAVAGHHGTLVKLTGDGALATFPLATVAVDAARQLVRELGAVGLPTRAGVHLGEVEVRGRDIGGLAVHVAARVADAASAGEVLATATVRTTTIGSSIAYGTPEPHELRGVPGTWELAPVLD